MLTGINLSFFDVLYNMKIKIWLDSKTVLIRFLLAGHASWMKQLGFNDIFKLLRHLTDEQHRYFTVILCFCSTSHSVHICFCEPFFVVFRYLSFRKNVSKSISFGNTFLLFHSYFIFFLRDIFKDYFNLKK